MIVGLKQLLANLTDMCGNDYKVAMWKSNHNIAIPIPRERKEYMQYIKKHIEMNDFILLVFLSVITSVK